MTSLASLAVWVILITTVSIFLSHRRRKLDIPRIGPKPGFLGNTSRSYWHTHCKELVEEGYAKYKDGLYALWTTDMDRVIVSSKFMKDFQSLPRSTVRLAASRRHAGPYTGMDIAEEGSLHFDVCSGQLTQKIGDLAQPVFDEIKYALGKKLENDDKDSGSQTIPILLTTIELITSATARAFVGPELCRDPDWLSTATGYTMDVDKVTTDLQTYYRFLHPVVYPFLPSFQRIRSRFMLAKNLLSPMIEARRDTSGKEHADLLQWMVDSAQGRDMETDRLVKRMLFLNMAAIHTSAIAAANAIIELCAHPDCIRMLREEMLEALQDDPEISLTTLNKLKKTDSFLKEAHRMNPLGLLTFNRHLAAPVRLSNGVTLPADTYISMPHSQVQQDPGFYPEPLEFHPLRFFDIRQKQGESDKHQFASNSSTNPAWGIGKYACPGRFWAGAQIKLLLIVLLLDYDIAFPEGQTKKPEKVATGGSFKTSVTQTCVLKRRASATKEEK